MIEQFVMPIYEVIIEYTYLYLIILLLVKFVQLIMSFKNGGSGSDGNGWNPWGDNNGNGNGNNGDSDNSNNNDARKNNKQLRDDQENGIGGTAYLKVLVQDMDDNPLRGAHVKIESVRGGHKFKADKVTNTDGIVPSNGQAISVPANTPIKIKVDYLLPKEYKYKSEKYKISDRKYGLQLLRNRYVTAKPHIEPMLNDGEDKTVIITLEIVGEEVTGFEPFIEKIELSEDKISTVGRIDGSTGK